MWASLLLCCVAFLLNYCPVRGTLDIYLNSTNEKTTLFHQVLQAHVHFGRVPTNETAFSTVHVLSDDDIELLCESLDNKTILNETLRPKYKDTVMVVILGSPLECSGRLNPSKFETIFALCELDAVILLENEANLLPAANVHDGKKFEGNPFKESCRYLFTPEVFTTELSRMIPNETYTARVTIDDNQFTDAFEQLFWQILLRFVLGAAFFYVAGLALYTFVERFRGRSLNFVFSVVLILNLGSALLLGVLQVSGMWFVADNMEFGLSMASFSHLFGTGVATEFLVSILYRDIVRRAFATRTCYDFTRSNCVFVTISFLLTIADWMLFAIICLGTLDLVIVVLLRLIIGLFFFVAQVWIAAYLSVRVWKMIRRIHPKGSTKSNNSQLEKHFRKWIKVSLIAAFFSTLALLAMAMDLILISPETWLGTLFASSMGKIFNLYSQTKVRIERRVFGDNPHGSSISSVLQ